MKKEILNEEFKRMQKLAGIINEDMELNGVKINNKSIEYKIVEFVKENLKTDMKMVMDDWGDDPNEPHFFDVEGDEIDNELVEYLKSLNEKNEDDVLKVDIDENIYVEIYYTDFWVDETIGISIYKK
jgi:hypothetical protein